LGALIPIHFVKKRLVVVRNQSDPKTDAPQEPPSARTHRAIEMAITPAIEMTATEITSDVGKLGTLFSAAAFYARCGEAVWYR
jgi:hypothetical protein